MRLDITSLKLAALENFCASDEFMAMWYSALLDKNTYHYHIQGPRYSGKTYLLEASFNAMLELKHSAVFITASELNHAQILEQNMIECFFIDDLDQLDIEKQSILIALIDQWIINKRKIFTTSNNNISLCKDLSSRLQSAYLVNLYYPQNEQLYSELIKAFFDRYYINVPEHIVMYLIKITSKTPSKLFPLMFRLAKEATKLTISKIKDTYLQLHD